MSRAVPVLHTTNKTFPTSSNYKSVYDIAVKTEGACIRIKKLKPTFKLTHLANGTKNRRLATIKIVIINQKSLTFQAITLEQNKRNIANHDILNPFDGLPMS